MKRKKKADRKGIYYVLLLVLVSLIITAIFLYTYQEKNRELETHKSVLIDRLAETLHEYKTIETENDSLKRVLNSGEAEITALMDSIRNHSGNNYEKLLNYERQFFAMERELKSLRWAVDSLVTVNDSLSSQNRRLSSEADSLIKEKQTLQNKIAKGAELRINSFRADGFNKKLNGQEEIVNGNFWVDFIRVCFNIEKNELTSPGRRVAYLRIVNPDNTIMKSDNKDPYIPVDGRTDLFYTQKFAVEYTGESVPKCLDVYRPKFIEGQYQVELYVDGKELASTVLTID